MAVKSGLHSQRKHNDEVIGRSSKVSVRWGSSSEVEVLSSSDEVKVLKCE